MDANVRIQVVWPSRFNYISQFKYMNKSFLKRLGLTLALFLAVVSPEVATAQQFVYNATGNVLAGFRKMNPAGGDQGNYELVVNLGSVTNFLNLTIGSSLTMTNVTYSALTNAFLDTSGSEPVLAQIKWSATTAVPPQTGSSRGNNLPWVTPLGTFPAFTLWFTFPATATNIQTTPPSRFGSSVAANYQTEMGEIGGGAISISGFLGASNANNNAYLVREPDTTYSSYDLTAFIGDAANNSLGDFGANSTPPMASGVVENTTPNPFSSSQRDDFYMLCPTGATNPITGSTNDSYFVGYFILNANGTMTFTRAAATVAAPTASFTGTPTTGYAPLTVVFANNSTGSFTNSVWNFGNGTIITNTTGGSVTNTYAATNTYTVSLTVNGAGGANTNTRTSYITVLQQPLVINSSMVVSSNKFTLSGIGGTASAQYHVVTSTNLTLSVTNWKPVIGSTGTFLGNGSFSFTYTNTLATNKFPNFFRLVSP